MTEKTLWQTAYNMGADVREKSTGIPAKVVTAFDDGELYLDDGSAVLSPVSEYSENDFEIVEA